MAPPRMTANPVRPARYRPGKAPVEEPASSDEEEDEEEQEEEASVKPAAPASKPKISSSTATKGLQAVNLSESRGPPKPAEVLPAGALDDEFETESSSESGSEDDDEEEDESSEEESSSEDDAPKLPRLTFVRKEQRGKTAAIETKTDESKWAEEEKRRKEATNDLLQEQMEKNAAAKAARKKNWDDDEVGDEDDIDDTDGLDPEAEQAAWKLRELKRVKREREKIEEAEKEREELERRRNLTEEERLAEDEERLAKQKEERDGRGKMAYMQKYHHKGAFFQEDLEASGLAQRDIMGSKFADQQDRSVLPAYMQIRDMTKLGRKGRSKYKDLKSEDTGRWGESASAGRPVRDHGLDARFQPDDYRGGGPDGPSGANAVQVRERRRSPRRSSRSPRREKERRSPSRSRSRSPADGRDRRKRSPSPRPEHGSEKRRKMEV